MTDTKLLREKIEESGYRIAFIASACGLSYQGLLNKINNKTEFTASEIRAIKNLLQLSDSESTAIFFAA